MPPPMLYYNSFCVGRQLVSPLLLYFAGRTVRSAGQIDSYLPYCDIPSGRYLSPAGETGPGRMRTPFVAVPIFAHWPSSAPDAVSSGDLLHIFEKQKEYSYLWQKN